MLADFFRLILQETFKSIFDYYILFCDRTHFVHALEHRCFRDKTASGGQKNSF